MTPQSIEAVSTHSSILVFTVFALGVEDRVHAGVVRSLGMRCKSSQTDLDARRPIGRPSTSLDSRTVTQSVRRAV